MPYLHHVTTDRHAMGEPRPFGPDFHPDTVTRAARMEVWCSSFEDPGPDYSLFKLLAEDGTVIATTRIEGY